MHVSLAYSLVIVHTRCGACSYSSQQPEWGMGIIPECWN